MKRFCAQFINSTRFYTYQTELKLIDGGIYDIECEDGTIYTTPVKIYPARDNGYRGPVKTVVKAKLLQAPPKKPDRIKKVYFNPTKGTTTVLWTDNTKTTVQCRLEDEFNVEFGVLACYMKRAYDNRGYYNEYVCKAIEEAEWS